MMIAQQIDIIDNAIRSLVMSTNYDHDKEIEDESRDKRRNEQLSKLFKKRKELMAKLKK